MEKARTKSGSTPVPRVQFRKKAVCVSMYEHQRELLEVLGKGNASAGFRLVLDSYLKKPRSRRVA